MKFRFLVVCAVLLVRPVQSSAQATAAQDQTPLIERLMARIDQLERRVSELETDKPRTTPAAAALPAPAALQAPAAHTAAGGHDQAPAAAPESYPALKVAGFSDFTFGGSDQRGTRSGFTEGQFILHVNSTLSERVSFLSELSFSARPDAGAGTPSATGFNAEVERSIIRFEQSDHLKLSFGRYHTPINYWNTAFHHGQWLQTSVSRPEMTQFGGKLIPVHFVGALVEGATPASGLNLNYAFGVGNGRGSVISRGGDAGDNNNNRAWLTNVFVKPDRIYGLQVGGSVYRDKITTAGSPDVGEWITSAHFVWQRETPELIGEVANVRHKPVGSGTVSNSQAYYIQAAYRLPWLEKLWKPYYRFEYTHIPKSDSTLSGVPSLAGSIIGLRYDLSSLAAIKFEYRNQRRAPGTPTVNAGFVQTSFTF